MREYWELDFSNYGLMLECIGGWTIGCENHTDNRAAVDRAIAGGLVGERIHRCPIDPEGWPSFELTDAGIEKVRELRGERGAMAAQKMRQWYRDNAAKYANA